jgi:hypothetical protein
MSSGRMTFNKATFLQKSIEIIDKLNQQNSKPTLSLYAILPNVMIIHVVAPLKIQMMLK